MPIAGKPSTLDPLFDPGPPPCIDRVERGQVEQHESPRRQSVEEVREPCPLGFETDPVGVIAVYEEDAELRGCQAESAAEADRQDRPVQERLQAPPQSFAARQPPLSDRDSGSADNAERHRGTRAFPP